MTYQEIVSEVKNFCVGAELKKYAKHLAVEVAITGEGEGVFYIEAKDGKINVEPYNYNDRDVRFTANAKNFLAIAKGELDPVKAFMTGRLKVDGSIDKALEFKSVVDEISAAKKKK